MGAFSKENNIGQDLAEVWAKTELQWCKTLLNIFKKWFIWGT